MTLKQLGLGKSQVYRSRLFAPARAFGLGTQGCQVFFGQTQSRLESLFGVGSAMSVELRFSQRGIEHLNQVIVRKLLNLILYRDEPPEGAVQLPLARFELS